ncbi:MAG TPA: winged helix-turn-helix domain-containing protein [Nitrosopumilaceae archaeon]|jgi:predicted transcriptional regulator
MESWKIEFNKDRYMAEIFASLVDSPKTALQIADDCKIPRSTVYRKLRKLEEGQVILRKGILENGVRNRLYKTIRVR